MRSHSIVAALALTGAAAAAAPALASPHAGDSARQAVSVRMRAHAYDADGLRGLRPGLVTFRVRDVSRLSHGMGIVRLGHGVTPRRAMKILAGDSIPARLPFELLGGVPELQPGQAWRATVHVRPGRYLLFDDGANGHGMHRIFRVRQGHAAPATPPRAVGSVALRDFRFGMHLPARWDGRGVIRVHNRGRQIHELTFVRFASAALERRFVSVLRKGYPDGPPPKGVRIFYAVGGMGPHETTWVHVHLPAGRYAAVCLFPDRKTGKPHTALGMLSTLVVRPQEHR